jgi:ABC-type xylose transport system substrate-binding protein
MKMTFSIDEALHKRLKIKAAKEDTTVKELITQGIHLVMGEVQSGKAMEALEIAKSEVAKHLAEDEKLRSTKGDMKFEL